MGVSKKDRVYATRRDGERVPVSLSEFSFLVKPAVYENFTAIGLEEKTGPGDVLSCAQEAKFDTHDCLAIAKKPLYLSEYCIMKGVGCQMSWLDRADFAALAKVRLNNVHSGERKAKS